MNIYNHDTIKKIKDMLKLSTELVKRIRSLPSGSQIMRKEKELSEAARRFQDLLDHRSSSHEAVHHRLNILIDILDEIFLSTENKDTEILFLCSGIKDLSQQLVYQISDPGISRIIDEIESDDADWIEEGLSSDAEPNLTLIDPEFEDADEAPLGMETADAVGRDLDIADDGPDEIEDAVYIEDALETDEIDDMAFDPPELEMDDHEFDAEDTASIEESVEGTRILYQSSADLECDRVPVKNTDIACLQVDGFEEDDADSPELEPEDLLKKALKKLKTGKILFNPPKVMKVGKTERVEARITQDLKAKLSKELKGRGYPMTRELKISEYMKVRLSGTDFKINALNEEEQFIGEIGEEEHTEWIWDVTPEKSGNQTLYLHVSVRIILPHGQEKKDHPVLNEEILVEINPAYMTVNFLLKHWKWLLATLLIPAGIAVWKKYFS